MSELAMETNTESVDAYRRKVMGMIALGYGYLVFVVLLAAGVLGGIAAIALSGTAGAVLVAKTLKFTWPILIVLALIIRSIFVRVPKPEGTYLAGEEKQRVLDFIEPVRVEAEGPKIHEVILRTEMNAAVTQIPLFGFFGPTKNYLILGVPLLQTMSEDEVRSVVAHEFGHLCHEDGRLGVSAYRLRETFGRAIDAIHNNSNSTISNWSFKFFHWFYPKFDKLSFSLCRQQEYKADEVAARVTSKESVAAALQRLTFVEPSYAKYWEQIWNQTKVSQQPDSSPWSRLVPDITASFDNNAGEAALKVELDRPTTDEDTHPSTTDRIRAVGLTPFNTLEPVENPAFEAIFKASAADLLRKLDGRWREDVSEYWAQEHSDWHASLEAFDDQFANRESLSEEEQLNLVLLAERVEKFDEAKMLIKAFVPKHITNPAGHFQLGRLLFEDDYPLAEAGFLECLNQDIEYYSAVQEWITYHYEQAGNPERAQELLNEYEKIWNNVVDAANAEREQMLATDTFNEPDVTEEMMAELVAFIGNRLEVREAWLVEKEVQHFKHRPERLLLMRINDGHSNVNFSTDTYISQFLNTLEYNVPWMGGAYLALVEKKSVWNELVERYQPIYRLMDRISEKGMKPMMYFWVVLALISSGFAIYTIFTW